MVSGEAVAAIGMTEPGAGSDLKAIRTTAANGMAMSTSSTAAKFSSATASTAT